jgi:hypothetical protein
MSTRYFYEVSVIILFLEGLCNVNDVTKAYDILPQNVREHFDMIMKQPSTVVLLSDGRLNISDNIIVDDFIDELSSKISDPPDLDGVDDEDLRKEIKACYQVKMISKVLGYTSSYIQRLEDKALSYVDIRQKLTEFGKDVEIVISSCKRRFVVKQLSEQQWGKYSLQHAEVIEVELVASLRREVNVRRANWESSKEYLASPKSSKNKMEEGFQKQLDEKTTTLWKILHLGANYLTPFERLKISQKTEGMDKKDRLAYVEENLVLLRKAYLDAFRKDRDNFVLPSLKS